MNALAHMSAGLAANYPNISEMRFDSYTDKDGGEHKHISDLPFVILAADNSNQIRSLRNDAMRLKIHFVDFVHTMTVGTYEEQKERTRNTPDMELDYWGLCMFGDKEDIRELTRKFSLWR